MVRLGNRVDSHEEHFDTPNACGLERRTNVSFAAYVEEIRL
jgi:hypothetical protein